MVKVWEAGSALELFYPVRIILLREDMEEVCAQGLGKCEGVDSDQEVVDYISIYHRHTFPKCWAHRKINLRRGDRGAVCRA